jgi:hypothetical protein
MHANNIFLGDIHVPLHFGFFDKVFFQCFDGGRVFELE